MPSNRETSTLQYSEVLSKLQVFCAYQERCHFEVRKKLSELRVDPQVMENIIASLIEGNFLNEERFARIFAGGKFRVKKWGRLKIECALRGKQVSEYCVRKGLEEIPEVDYITLLDRLVEEKFPNSKADNIYTKRNKVAKFLINRGFEPELVWTKLKEIG